MAEIDDLIIKIGADVSQLKKALKDTGKASDEVGDKFGGTEKAIKKVERAAKVYALTLAGVVVATKALQANLRTLNSTSALLGNAKNIGINVVKYQELNNAVKTLGGTQDQFQDSIKTVTERIGEAATEGGTFAESFKAMGLEVEKLNAMEPGEAFIAVIDGLNNMEDTSKRSYRALEVGGDSFNDVAGKALLAGKSFQEYTQDVKAIIKPMGEDAVIAASNLSREMNVMKVQFENSMEKIHVAASLAFVSVFSDFKDIGKEGTAMADTIEDVAKSMVAALFGVRVAISPIVAGFHLATGAALSAYAATEKLNEKNKSFIDKAKDMFISITDLDGSVSALTNAYRVNNTESEKFGSLMESATGHFNSAIKAVNPEEIMVAFEEANKQIEALLNKAKNKKEEDKKEEELKPKTLTGEDLNEEKKRKDGEATEFQKKLLEDFTQAEKDAAAQSRKNFDTSRRYRVQSYGQMFGQLATLQNTNSRKMFEVGKAANIAEGLTNTYLGATKALASFPPPFNFAMAAAVTLAGLNNVNNIRSQSFGGGGGGGGGGSAAIPSAPPPAQAAPQETIQNTEVHIGLVSETGTVSHDQVRSLGEQLNELSGDNFNISVD